VPASKKKKKAGSRKRGASPQKPEQQTVQVQLYLRPSQVTELDGDTAARQEEVRQLMGESRKVSRSAHGGSIISNYLRCRQLDADLTYQDFWDRVQKAITKRKAAKK
jgi:hypothetical protein